MTINKSYVFVGAREYVLKEMIKLKLNINAVWVMKDTFLHKRLEQNHFIDYEVIATKQELIKKIENTNFDVLVSNGNKYILPISKLKEATYVNIHPSYLPDLKGKNPINAAFLFGRSCGATYHIMDDGIDTGSIISQIEVPITSDIDASILYQLCFKAEVEVFKMALKNNFKVSNIRPFLKEPIYYSAKQEDWLVRFDSGFDYILKQVKAFGYKSHGVFFSCNGKNYKFFNASELTNSFIKDYFNTSIDKKILLSFEDTIVFKLENRFIRFDGVENRYSLQEGMILEDGILEFA